MRVVSRRSVLVALGVLAVLLVVGAAFGVSKAIDRRNDYRVPSEAMAPTLRVGATVDVEDLHGGKRPRVGDIVVASPPRGADLASYGGAADDTAPCAEADNLKRGRPCPRARGGRADEKYVERVVAGPGDTVAFRRGRTIRNGRDARERFLSRTCDDAEDEPETPCELPHAITLGPDRWYLVGDNRGESSDSRLWGPVPGDWLVARVVKIRNPGD